MYDCESCINFGFDDGRTYCYFHKCSIVSFATCSFYKNMDEWTEENYGDD